ncbi:MAG: alpha/beta fold hydrolase [Gammaproteobacteria bacterium]
MSRAPCVGRLSVLALLVLLSGALHPAVCAPAGDAATGADTVVSGRAQVDDVVLYYEVRGAGVPLLLLHGGFGHTGSWQRQAAAFAAAGFRVIAIDSRGHGRSTLSDTPLGYTRMADDVLGVMDTLGIARAHLVGWSDGGNIGLDIAMRHPGRLLKLVAYGANYRVAGVREDVADNPTFSAYVEQAHRDYLELSPQPARWDEFVTRIGAMWAREPNHSDAALRAITVPLLVLHGAEEEAIEGSHAAALATLVPGARFVVMPGTGHFAMREQPGEFNRIVLDFLRD